MLTEEPKVQIVECLFNALFDKSEKTILVSGAEEPLYLPSSSENEYNQIFSTSDYFSSALHEISHWCVAGATRRKLIDYGYWYEPDGRSEKQQLLFEQVEVKPQAMEWIFTVAAGQKFRLSVDNINQPEIKPSDEFKLNVTNQAQRYLLKGLPDRAQIFLQALLNEFKVDSTEIACDKFVLSSLD